MIKSQLVISTGLMVAFFGLIPAFAWGVSDFLSAKSAQRFGALKAAFVINSLGALVYLVFYGLFLHFNTSINSDGLIFALVGSVSFGLAQVSFFKSVALGPLSLVSPISSTYPLISLVVGLLLFNARVTFIQVIGILLIVAGVMVASGLWQTKKSEMHSGRGPVIALGAAAGWGIGLGFIAHATTMMSWQNVFLIEQLVAPIVLLFVMPVIKGGEIIDRKSLIKLLNSPFVWGAGALQMTGLLTLNLGLANIPTAVAMIVAISSCYPALTILIAFKHMRERTPMIPLLGGVAGIVGVIVLVLGA